MRCQVITKSLLHNLAQVTLLTTDLEAFKMGQEYEVSLTEAAPLPAPAPAPDGTTPTEKLPENILSMVNTEAKEPPFEDINSKPTPCDLCKGSGVVALFEGDQNTGRTEICDCCKGTGIKPPETAPAS